MRCPSCGYEETGNSVCSQCHNPLASKTKKPATNPPAPVVPSKKPARPAPPDPPEEKHRRRPLMDLDLTIPELVTEEEKTPDPPKTDSEKS